MRVRVALTSALALALAAGACSKSDPPSPATTVPTTATATPSATPNAATSASATPSSAPVPSASAAIAAPDGGTTDASIACGSKGLPDCPMQKWMRDNTANASQAGDTAALAKALDAIVVMAPPGYTNWVSISKDGAAAARAGELDATRASCTECHKQYKNKYKAEMRARPLPPLP